MMSKFVENLFIKFDSPLVNVFTVIEEVLNV